MKEITIDNKNYKIDCNALTRFKYKKIFNSGILEDISKINSVNEKRNEVMKKYEKSKMSENELNEKIGIEIAGEVDKVLDVILQLAYILILTANPDFDDFENWLSTIKKINISDSWISEVTEIAVSSFC